MSYSRTLLNHNPLFFNSRSERKVLDGNNAVWAVPPHNKQLHPTRGWRKVSVKKTLIADITQRMKSGQRGVFNTANIKAVLQRRLYI